MTRMTTATTSRRWIKPPPTWPMKPISQSTTRMTIIVQSMGIPFDSVKLSSANLSSRLSTRQAFSEHRVEQFSFPAPLHRAIGYARFYSRSHDAVIHVFDEAGNAIETHKHVGDFREF